MVWIVQDKDEGEFDYIVSCTSEEDAWEQVRFLEAVDREEGTYQKDRYQVSEHGFCCNDFSEKCGYCRSCICMLVHPDADCPLVKQRSRLQEAGEYADQPALQPGA